MVLDLDRKERAEAQEGQARHLVPRTISQWTQFHWRAGRCVEWIATCEFYGHRPSQEPPHQLISAVDSTMRLFVRDFAKSLDEYHALTTHTTHDSSRRMLDDLMRFLSIDSDGLAKILAVPPLRLQQYLLGTRPMPPHTQRKLRRAHTSLLSLLRIFRSDRLPTVVRRPAELFNGSSALDVMFDGRIDQVVKLYDRALTYQS